MKKIVEFFLNPVRGRLARRDVYHNDALRGNQFNDRGPTFSFWRALVS